MNKKPVMIDEKCPRCNGPMVTHPDYIKPYCGSWEYMEGGCPPPPTKEVKDVAAIIK